MLAQCPDKRNLANSNMCHPKVRSSIPVLNCPYYCIDKVDLANSNFCEIKKCEECGYCQNIPVLNCHKLLCTDKVDLANSNICGTSIQITKNVTFSNTDNG